MAGAVLRLLPVVLLLTLTAPPAAAAAALATASAAAEAKNVSIDSATLSFADLTLLGDSFLRNGSVGLTRDTGVPSSSAGSVLCTQPVAFRGPTNATAVASFAARFSFVIANPNAGAAGGDGLAFFISPGRATLGATGGYLGLFNSSDSAKNGSAIVAIEFDTMANPEFADPSDNHVGLDLGSPVSVAAADLAASGIDLKSGNLTTAWINYRSVDRRLEVFLSYAPAGKPKRPVLSVAVDLSPYLKGAMYVGFSASTEGSTQQHTIKEWTFQTFGFPSTANASSFESNATSNSSEQAVPVSTAPHKRVGLALGILGPVALAVAFVFFAWVSIKKLMELTAKNDGAFSPELLKGPRKFSYKELSVATRGFHASRVVGKGAFGTVYKAAMPGAATIAYAVKRSTQAHQSRSEFVAELSVIACLRHKNLVQLEGWCDEKGELLLVYEYMPNGSLDKALYGDPCTLSWPQRYTVAAGIASVLSYLHQECEQRVIHRDIKTSNILLDGNLSPRLGDFGLARLMDHNKSPVSTLTAGTMGYLAPEYLQSGKATEQTDVFSYGVVVLEVCCGRRPIDKDDGGGKNVNLVDWVWCLHGEDRLIEAADVRLAGEFDRDEMLRLLLVGLSCANPNCEERPAMRRVVQILNREAELAPVPPKKPLLVFSSSASMKLQEIAFSCGDDVRGGYSVAKPTSPMSEGADIER
ncbi:putative L-type lectin-domain containing receptor kinase S.7 [Dichanthelium oligosanthes]|uniref:non-specific serine/threonine protein kinase n=1 Tax=Dichanthelium oligosanthes TaxID=888268 RepID=A0A1E5W3V2_9POAL|nr:putative L-type lectin-domain containing receptor kinase S.7 [Dichanthelium oligosanthes]